MWYAKPSGPYDKYSTEGTANILEMRDILRNDYGWTDEAITGAITNSIYEGGLNPWRWQQDTYPAPSGVNPDQWGCGLFGFTGYPRYLSLSGSGQMNLSTTTTTAGASPNVGIQQVNIMADGTWGWIAQGWRSSWDPALYPDQYNKWLQVVNAYGDGTHLYETDYAQINDIESAVMAFLCCFEGPRIPNYYARVSVANEVYAIITGHPPHPPTPIRRKTMPVYMMIKKFI